MEPEKSSIGESSSSTSSSPPTSPPSPRAAARSRQSGVPTNQAKDSVCRSRSPGTSSGSRIFAKDTRNGAPGIPPETPSFVLALVWVETAKMRPSSTSRASRGGPRPSLVCYILGFSLVTTRTRLEQQTTEATPEGWDFRSAIKEWTGGSQRNVQTYTYLYGGVKVPPRRSVAWLTRRAGSAGCVPVHGRSLRQRIRRWRSSTTDGGRSRLQ